MANEALYECIQRQHTQFFRFLNDSWIFAEELRPVLDDRANQLAESGNQERRSYRVPRGTTYLRNSRTDNQIAELFSFQHERGIFETTLISVISRAEAFIQECVSLTVKAYPPKLAILAEKSALPLDIFLENDNREDVIESFIDFKCEGLMFQKPREYLAKAAEVMGIKLDANLLARFIEVKASRDIIIHNRGVINKSYITKAGRASRGLAGQTVTVDEEYFRDTISLLKDLSASVRDLCKEQYAPDSDDGL